MGSKRGSKKGLSEGLQDPSWDPYLDPFLDPFLSRFGQIPVSFSKVSGQEGSKRGPFWTPFWALLGHLVRKTSRKRGIWGPWEPWEPRRPWKPVLQVKCIHCMHIACRGPKSPKSPGVLENKSVFTVVRRRIRQGNSIYRQYAYNGPKGALSGTTPFPGHLGRLRRFWPKRGPFGTPLGKGDSDNPYPNGPFEASEGS